MSADVETSGPESGKVADGNPRFSRRNLLFASTAAAAAPALGTTISVEPARAQQRFDYPPDREAKNAARTLALEALLVDKGIITGNSVDSVLSFFETQMGPFNGAKVVAHAWVDPAFKQRLVEDTPAAIAGMQLPKGMAGAEGEHMRTVANFPIHRPSTISSFARCVPVTPGRCSGFRPIGIRTRPSGPERRVSRARC
jgi:Nitrile hydratase, alpha chain